MSNQPAMRSVRVRPPGPDTDSRTYDVLIGPGALRSVREFIPSKFGSHTRAFLIHDAAVPDARARELPAASVVKWSAREGGKTLGAAELFLAELARERFDRSSLIIALGGGITGDVAGFVAGIYQRGIPWINCPTTLLAMVDAAIGGKTGVNLALADTPGEPLKNYIGVIHHPVFVAADTDLLATLPDRVFRAGLAECLKHTMIAADWSDPELPEWFHAALPKILTRDTTALTELIIRNIELKARVVEADERESGGGPGGGRMSLNLGHTFAHAFETLPGTSIPDGRRGIEHGEAVALGLIAAANCAAALGLVNPRYAADVKSWALSCSLPTRVAGLPADAALIARMSQDKKTRSGTLRLVLPCGSAQVRVVDNPPVSAVAAGFDAIRA